MITKKIIGTLFFCAFSLSLLYSQVGINTSSPQGVLHIKSSIGTSDIVVSSAVGKEGYVGVGTLTPSHKLHINTTSALKALRISDTTEGVGKVLMSDKKAGVALWREKQGSWFGALIYGAVTPTVSSTTAHAVTYGASFVSDYSVGGVNQSTGKITVPYKGMYRVSVFGSSIMHPSRYSGGYFIAGFLIIYANNGEIWAPHSLGNTNLSRMQYFSYTRLVYLPASAVLHLTTTNLIPAYADGLDNFSFYVELVKQM